MDDEKGRPIYKTCEAQAAGDSQMFCTEHAEMLTYCDRIHTCEEREWFIIRGFQWTNGTERLVVYAHTNSDEDYLRLLEMYTKRQNYIR